jgi:GYD domain
MAKYAVLGGYTAEAWSKMVDNPGDRTAALRKVAEALGGKLESFYWSFGDDDYLRISMRCHTGLSRHLGASEWAEGHRAVRDKGSRPKVAYDRGPEDHPNSPRRSPPGDH